MADKIDTGTDVLMITYNRPAYTARSLHELLRRSDDSVRVWVWHNGDDEETLEVVSRYRERLHRYHHSRENVALRTPTNWLYENASGCYVSKVDDDCIVPQDWTKELRRAHEDEPRFGVIGCWRFQDEDFIPEVASKKLRTFDGGHQLLVNLWIEGSGYLMKRKCVESCGPIRETESFTQYCLRIRRKGWVNGWIYRFLHQEHLDDPRVPGSAIKSDEDLIRNLPLSAKRNGVTTVDQWIAQLRRSARIVQEASPNPSDWSFWKQKLRGFLLKIQREGLRRT